jgi:hypothetical protein
MYTGYFVFYLSSLLLSKNVLRVKGDFDRLSQCGAWEHQCTCSHNLITAFQGPVTGMPTDSDYHNGHLAGCGVTTTDDVVSGADAAANNRKHD